jgi:glucose-1-phosphate cytidylyltransferase
MKTAILAGGLGTRMKEVTRVIPKPMVTVGPYPILWHIMKHYSHFGINEFCIALGYRGDIIKDYFLNYHSRLDDISVNLQTKDVHFKKMQNTENWIVNLIETGDKTMTGGRIARMKDYLKDEAFFLTYGDGVSNINVKALLEFHKSHGKIGTVSAVSPPSRFGILDIKDTKRVESFKEKPNTDSAYINGGFFVFEPAFLDYLSTDETCVLEQSPLENLAKDGQLMAYEHDGFWQCMDTMRDIDYLNDLWEKGDAPWQNYR